MKIIARQGSGSNRYLVSTEGDKGFVADFDQGYRFPEMRIGSITKAGYWELFKHDDKLLVKIMKLPIF